MSSPSPVSFPRLLQLAAGILALSASGVRGYKAGAPAIVCDDMTPTHYGAEVKSAKVSSPFTLTANQYIYAENESPYITVTLANKPNAPILFKGFMLQARDENNTRIGFWSIHPRSNLKLLNCSGDKDTAVTHSEKISKDGVNKVQAIWIAPDDDSGNITFRATVVQHKLMVHMDLNSAPVVWQDGASSLSISGLCLALCTLLASLWRE